VASATTSFTVRQLNPGKTYALVRDGKPLGHISEEGQLPSGTRWQDDGSLLITTALREQSSFIIKAI